MILVDPSIDPAVAALAPGFRALSITVAAAPITNPDVGALALAQACRALGERTRPGLRRISRPGAMSSCGLAPNPSVRPVPPMPCASALRDGTMPSIDPVVDLYNAVSIRYAVPVGARISRLMSASRG